MLLMNCYIRNKLCLNQNPWTVPSTIIMWTKSAGCPSTIVMWTKSTGCPSTILMWTKPVNCPSTITMWTKYHYNVNKVRGLSKYHRNVNKVHGLSKYHRNVNKARGLSKYHCNVRKAHSRAGFSKRMHDQAPLSHTPSIAFFSATFLQTLPVLVTPLKRHFWSPRSCPRTLSAPSERFRY